MEPVVTYGRLTGICWLRLQKKEDTVKGYISMDGKTWEPAGTTTFKGNKCLAGIAVASGIAGQTTTLMFDSLEIKK